MLVQMLLCVCFLCVSLPTVTSEASADQLLPLLTTYKSDDGTLEIIVVRKVTRDNYQRELEASLDGGRRKFISVDRTLSVNVIPYVPKQSCNDSCDGETNAEQLDTILQAQIRAEMADLFEQLKANISTIANNMDTDQQTIASRFVDIEEKVLEGKRSLTEIKTEVNETKTGNTARLEGLRDTVMELQGNTARIDVLRDTVMELQGSTARIDVLRDTVMELQDADHSYLRLMNQTTNQLKAQIDRVQSADNSRYHQLKDRIDHRQNADDVRFHEVTSITNQLQSETDLMQKDISHIICSTPAPVVFQALLSNHMDCGSDTVIAWNDIKYDNLNALGPDGMFTCPYDGIYLFGARALTQYRAGGLHIYMKHNNTEVLRAYHNHDTGIMYNTVSGTVYIQAKAGDKVWVTCHGPAGVTGGRYTSFNGQLISYK